MKLRHQLLILSLFALSIPWAGFQYIQEMQRVMLEGNERELVASAHALALMLADENELFSGADELSSPSSIYFHDLPSPPTLDGYADEWRDWPVAPATMSRAIETTSTGSYQAGRYQGNLFLLLKISDSTPTWSTPTRAGDQLQIITSGGDVLNLSPVSPGVVRGQWQSDEFGMAGEYRLQAFWRDSSDGHQIELKVLPGMLDGILGLRYLDRGSDAGGQLFAGIERGQASHYTFASQELDERLEIFATQGLRLGVSDRSGWVVGRGGELQFVGASQQVERNTLLPRIYSLLLSEERIAALDDWPRSGQFQTLDVLSSLTGQTRTAVFSFGNLRVHRAAVPIVRGGEVLGVVIAEKSSASVVEATDTAFGRLAFWAILATLLVAMGLLLYATVLSIRIRRLSAAAQSAMQDPASGSLADRFPDTGSSDEIGDLNRAYKQLLGRLDEYTLYLKTLTGKLSHELRTPLAIIRSSLDNLDQEQLDAGARIYSERASEGTSRLAGILNAMSTASHLEQSIKTAEFETFDLNELVENAGAGYRDAYPETNIQVHSPNHAVKVFGSPDLIMQLLDKLVDNARDFCPEKGVIELELQETETTVRLAVSNDGPLLPEHMQAQLFDSLVSVREKRETNSAHLGLGLYIVRLIAERHNARVFAENRADGSGVVFGLELLK
jgi:two-component system, OmpR family, sensor histidine kinase ChvG